MVRTLTSYVCTIVFTVAMTSVAWAGPPREPIPANVGQVDLSGAWACPLTYPYFPNDGQPLTFTPFPLSLSLTTTGGPVLFTLTMSSAESGTGANITLMPVVDQQAMGAEVRWHTYSSHPALGLLTRIISVPAGTHSFGAMIACQNGGDAHTVTQAWLSAYELPMVAR